MNFKVDCIGWEVVPVLQMFLDTVETAYNLYETEDNANTLN